MAKSAEGVQPCSASSIVSDVGRSCLEEKRRRKCGKEASCSIALSWPSVAALLLLILGAVDPISCGKVRRLPHSAHVHLRNGQRVCLQVDNNANRDYKFVLLFPVENCLT